jgi:hypothetical protein
LSREAERKFVKSTILALEKDYVELFELYLDNNSFVFDGDNCYFKLKQISDKIKVNKKYLKIKNEIGELDA